MKIEQKIESVLLFKNEPVSEKELAEILDTKVEIVHEAIKNLKEFYKDRGVIILDDGEYISFGTHPDASEFISLMQKEELSRELGRAGLETLAIVLYKGPVSRREIDNIRGVNSSFILRNLMIRGLVERVEGNERSFSYKPTLELLKHLGVREVGELPEYGIALRKMEEFVKNGEEDANE